MCSERKTKLPARRSSRPEPGKVAHRRPCADRRHNGVCGNPESEASRLLAVAALPFRASPDEDLSGAARPLLPAQCHRVKTLAPIRAREKVSSVVRNTEHG